MSILENLTKEKKEGGVGSCGFAVSAIFQIGFSSFLPKNFVFSDLMSVAVSFYFAPGFRQK